MTVSINAVVPMAASAASSPAASALAPTKPAGSSGGKSSSFGAMVDDAADSRPQQGGPAARRGTSVAGSEASKARGPGDSVVDDGQPQQAAMAQAEAEASADALIPGQETPPVDPQLADAVNTAGTDIVAEPVQMTVQEEPEMPVQTTGQAVAKPIVSAAHLATTKTIAANRAGAATIVQAESATEVTAGTQGDIAPTEPVDGPETGKNDGSADAVAADEQAPPLPIQQANLLAQPTAPAAVQVALASVTQPVVDDGGTPAAPTTGEKGQVEASSAGTFAPAASSRGVAGKSVAFGAATKDVSTSAGTAHTLAAVGDGAGEGVATTNTASSHADGATLSSPVLSQTFSAAVSRPAALPYPASTPSATQSATVSMQEGRFGTDIGVQIARALDKGSDDLLIKLDPRHLGRIDVRLSFDHGGVLRAVMSADSSTATDLLRRESTDLNRALADAGIRADGQSLRFDTRAGGQGAGQGNGQNSGQGGQRWQGQQAQADDSFGGADAPVYRSLRSSGHVDLMA